tara:strand:- start:213 stop:1082 length:870 start_codon:yes stop_codon:yes gene_type:complete
MIIWIASYPKSGNTWIRSLLSAYLFSDNANFDFPLLKKILKFPSKKYLRYFTNDFSDVKKVSDYWIAAQDRLNLFNENKTTLLKTHSALCTLEKNPFTNKNNTQAVIYIVRDPRNVITSVANHYTFSVEQSYDFMTDDNQIITEDKWGTENFGISTVLGSWSTHYKSWKNIKFAPILNVKYEDLVKDTKNSLIRILNFLEKFMDIKIDEKKIVKAIESCNFENLKKMEKNDGFDEAAFSEKLNKKVVFFNLGEKNNWKNLLKPEMEKKIRKIFNKEMKELGYIGAGEGN